jgi:hypothetical protein
METKGGLVLYKAPPAKQLFVSSTASGSRKFLSSVLAKKWVSRGVTFGKTVLEFLVIDYAIDAVFSNGSKDSAFTDSKPLASATSDHPGYGILESLINYFFPSTLVFLITNFSDADNMIAYIDKLILSGKSAVLAAYEKALLMSFREYLIVNGLGGNHTMSSGSKTTLFSLMVAIFHRTYVEENQNYGSASLEGASKLADDISIAVQTMLEPDEDTGEPDSMNVALHFIAWTYQKEIMALDSVAVAEIEGRDIDDIGSIAASFVSSTSGAQPGEGVSSGVQQEAEPGLLDAQYYRNLFK